MELPYLNNVPKTKVQTLDFRGYNHTKEIADNELYDMKNLSSDLYPLLSQRKHRGLEMQLTDPKGLYAKEELCYVDNGKFYYDGTEICNVSNSPKRFYSIGSSIIIMPDCLFYDINTGYAPLQVSNTASAKIESSTISGTGIGVGIGKGDGITISGSTNEENNKTAIVLSATANNIHFAQNTLTDQETASLITVKRLIPDMDFMTECDNRLFGCNSAKHEIYASKLGDPKNWNVFQGIASDSYAATVGSDGDFTGICTYMGHVIFFKEDRLIKLYGNKPSNFQLVDTEAPGVKKGSENSIVNVNGNLFYHSPNGVCVYQGSIPSVISDKLGEEKYSMANAGAYRDKYYMSAKDSSNNYSMLVFDTKKGLWHKEDDTHAIYFTELNNELYYIDYDTKKIMKVVGNYGDDIEWFAEFGDYDGSSVSYKNSSGMSSFNSKRISKLAFRYELGAFSTVSFYIKYDSADNWELIGTRSSTSAEQKQKSEMLIVPRRCDHFRIKIAGEGECNIYSIVKTLARGSE